MSISNAPTELDTRAYHFSNSSDFLYKVLRELLLWNLLEAKIRLYFTDRNRTTHDLEDHENSFQSALMWDMSFKNSWQICTMQTFTLNISFLKQLDNRDHQFECLFGT